MGDPAEGIDRRTVLSNALAALEDMQSKLAAIERSRTEPIAIIGMGCRFPGGANDPEAFWQLLRDGGEAITEVPPDRWDINAYYDPDPEAPGKMYTRYSGFLDQVDQFDARFFSIPPREAVSMDPQQRLLLEVSWEALENAGQVPGDLAGSQTGVFIGITTNDYGQLLRLSGPEGIDAYHFTGNHHNFAAGRLSYTLGLQGPAMAVDTACSSSLVAVHLACRSLRTGECNLALAGGVNLILSPEETITACKARMLAADGRCKTFDARADGIVRGEGCGILVLKRLSEAVAYGDNILAVIRGSAVNQDGASSGLTVPNILSQQAVIRKALADAGAEPAQVSYVEAHGTGTTLGDPIEVRALGAVLGQGRATDHYFMLGSVKTNIGHLESAAGVAGLIKIVLALQHQEIPPHLHLQHLNPYIAWDDIPAVIPTKRTPWPAGNGRRMAGVSAFGGSGTNAHVIVEEAPLPKSVQVEVERPLHLLSLSAKEEGALKALVGRLERYLAEHPSAALADVGYTVNAGRTHFPHRLAIIAESSAQMHEKLAAFAAGRAPAGMLSGQVHDTRQPKVTFLFTGQGSQYIGMGRRLYDTQPTFRKALDKCDELLRPYLEQPLLSVLYPDLGIGSPLDETAYTQPALFALEYALAELWRSWGVEPSALMGHSVGEYVAACVAGVFSLEEGLKLVAHRSRLMQALPRDGEMVAVLADEARVAAVIAPYAGAVSIAAINSPEDVVISGSHMAVRAVLERLQEEGIKAWPLKVSHAFHSPLMEPMLAPFEQMARQVQFKAPRIPLISNVTGQMWRPEDIPEASYWRRHVWDTVRFSAAMTMLHKQGYELFVELGPSPTLLGMGKRCVPEAAGTWLPSLRQGRDDWQQMLESAAALDVRGVEVDWAGFDRDYPRRRLMLPTYPFQRKRYWPDAARPRSRGTYRDPRNDAFSAPRHPWLERVSRSPLIREVLFESSLSTKSLPLLEDHRIHGMAVVPATAYVEMALAAAWEALGSGSHSVEDITIREALILPEGAVRTVQLVLTPEDAETASFQVISLDTRAQEEQAAWRVHTTGKVRIGKADAVVSARAQVSPAEVRARCLEQLSVRTYYQRLGDCGLQFGPRFQGLAQLWRRDGEALGQVRLPEMLASEAEEYQIHPALLDACLQIFAATWPSSAEQGNAAEAYLPISLQRFQLYTRPGTQVWSHALLRPNDAGNPETFTGDIRLFGEDGRIVAEVEALLVKRVSREMLQRAAHEQVRDWLYQIAWLPKARVERRAIGLPPDHMLTPRQIAERVHPQLARLSAQHGLTVYEELLPQLDALSVAYVVNAFRELGWDFGLQQRVSVDSLAAQLGVVDQHRRLLGRLLEMLQEDGVLRKVDSEWEVRHVPAVADPQERCAVLLTEFPAGNAELTLIARCGQRLAQALRGECDPLQLLFPDGSLALAENLYHGSPFFRLYNSLIQEAFTAALEHLPSNRIVRILEIGAGTGGTTAHVLPGLPADRTEYVFTDISPLFTSKAQQKFRDYAFMQYQLLDIERDPMEQAFTSHQFDVILAANVLHATTDLRQTLRHVRQLLAPGGLLVLLEATIPQRYGDLSVGLTEGWWKFADGALRPSYALISQRKWVDLLEEMGFTEAVAIPQQEDSAGGLSRQAVILARGPGVGREAEGEDVVSLASESSGNWLIFADQGGVGQQLYGLLRSYGERCLLVTPGEAYAAAADGHFRLDPARPEDFRRLLHEVLGADRPPCSGVIHLWALDAQAPEDITIAALEQGQIGGCGSILHLIQALVTAGGSKLPGLWLVTRGAQPVGPTLTSLAVTQASVWGLGNVIALEHPELHCVRVDLDPAANMGGVQNLFDELWRWDLEDQVAYRDNVRHVARLVRHPSQDRGQGARQDWARQPVQLAIATPGILDGLVLRPMMRRHPGPGEVEIRVHAIGLNFRDVLNVLGAYPGEAGPLGGECAGKVVAVGEGVVGFQAGDEVIAIAPGSFSTFVTTRADLVVFRPDDLSVEDAATIPGAFVTAYYALHHVGKMARGERVLIHAAAGGVGLAAVQLAQRAGAEIFGTAGNPEKREFLKSLGVQHVMDSRSLDFADEVMERTRGLGVDIVLNSLSGAFIPKSLSVLGANGRFLEIGRRDIWDERQVAQLRSDVSSFVINLAEVCQENPAMIGSILHEAMEAFRAGSLKPLPRRVFPIEEVVNAFRYMAQAKHIGKIVVSQQGQMTNLRRAAFDSHATYLITGGLGGLGLRVAQWMVERGARYLLLMGRSGASNAAHETIRRLEQTGARIVVAQGDVSKQEHIARVLGAIGPSLPPLRGVVHAAGVLDDGVLLQQDWQRFAEVMAPKVAGTWNLHTLTRNMPLDFFVLFSSAVSILGSAGQGNHAGACAFLDALASHRRAQGLPALSVNWGPWSDIGAAARRKIDERTQTKGIGSIVPQQGLQVLEQVMQQTSPQIVVLPVHWSKFLQDTPADREPPLLSELAHEARANVKPQSDVRKHDLRRQLEQAPLYERHKLLHAHVREQVSKVLGLDPSFPLDALQGLRDIGMDSLMSIELKNRLHTSTGLSLPSTLAFDYPTITALVEYLAGEALPLESPTDGSLSPSKDRNEQAMVVAELEQLSDAEAEALLVKEMSIAKPGN